MEFELTSAVIDNVLTMRISTKPGSDNKGANHAERFVKVCFLSFILWFCLNLTLRGRGKLHYWYFYDFKPAGSGVNHSKAHEVNFCSVFATECVQSDQINT